MKISRSALVPYRAEQLYDLINDIESYPRFLDGCTGAEILQSDDHKMVARLDISKGGARQSFTTCNRLNPVDRVIMELVDGPFESFAGVWKIKPLGDVGCRLSLDLEFELNSGFLAKILGKFYAEMGNRLVDAICREAGLRYSGDK